MWTINEFLCKKWGHRRGDFLFKLCCMWDITSIGNGQVIGDGFLSENR